MPKLGVRIANQFGALTLDTTKERELCFPSTIGLNAGYAGSPLALQDPSGPIYLASSYVSDLANARSGLQNALDALASTGGTLKLDSAGTYVVDGNLTLSSRTGFIVDLNGNTIKAADGMTCGGGAAGSIFYFRDCTFWGIKNGTIDGNRAHRAVAETYGHNVLIEGGHDFSLDTLTIENAPCADNVYITSHSNDGSSAASWASNGLLYYLTLENAYRNDLSVINASNVECRGGAYENANGTSPQAGIDFEADVATAGTNDTHRDLWVHGIRFSGNNGSAVKFTAIHSNANGPDRATVEGCLFDGNGAVVTRYRGLRWDRGGGPEHPGSEEHVPELHGHEQHERRDGPLPVGTIVNDDLVVGNSFDSNRTGEPVVYVHGLSGNGNLIAGNDLYDHDGPSIA